MREYYNPHPYSVTLIGPDGKTITVKSRARLMLPQYFDRYRTRGFIKLVTETISEAPAPRQIQASINLTKTIQRRVKQNQTTAEAPPTEKKRTELLKVQKRPTATGRVASKQKQAQAKQVVGRTINVNATAILGQAITEAPYPISNNIGIGILSFNRGPALQRLLESIIRYTDLQATTVFISDDGSTDPETIAYLNALESHPAIVVIRNNKRLGIAGNSNRLLRCLNRFRYGLLLNDDVEVLQAGWDSYYFGAMHKTGFHHFIYRQPGVYGADLGASVNQNGTTLKVVYDKPHGAVLAFTNEMLQKVGYFDERYGLYGMEHVDWSQKAWEFGLQNKGFYDVEGSFDFFKIHADMSAVEDRHHHLAEARKTFAARSIQRYEPSPDSAVPGVTYVVPFRNTDRDNSICTVINNIRGQRYPVIEIIMVEQDAATKIDLNKYLPVNYILVPNRVGDLFNKSTAFNVAVSRASFPHVILQDADMLSQWRYTSKIMDILSRHDACHVGARVVYADRESTERINARKTVSGHIGCERVVGYFEGGSSACTVKTYWKVGGHNEDYWGYGCFIPETPIGMADGTVKSIDSIENGEWINTHSGKCRQVVRRFDRHYNGNVYRLKLASIGYKCVATPNHEFYVRRGDNYEWIMVKDLRIGDLIAVQLINDDSIDKEIIDVGEELTEGTYTIRDGQLFPTRLAFNKLIIDGSAKGCPRNLIVDDDLLSFIGYYAAEGCASPKNGIRFSVCEDEFDDGDIGSELVRIITKLGFSYRINKRGGGRGRDIQFFCLPLVRLLNKWFPQKRNEKKFPLWVMQLPPHKQLIILAALIDGDGYISRRGVRLRMGSEQLVAQAMMMAKRNGMEPYHYYTKLYNRYNVYEMAITMPNISDGLCELLHIPPRGNQLSNNQLSLREIKEIEISHYSGPVYNLEVDCDHSYTVGFGIAKNCEDCDFYARLSGGADNWFGERTVDFLHLWHPRVEGWNSHHEANKLLESKLKMQPTQARITLQHDQLKRLGYI